MPLRASIPTIREGLVSPGLAKAYREVLGELSKGVEPPERDIRLKPEEGLPTGIARLLKLYTLDIPGSFLKRGGEALESPDALTSEDLLRLAGEATLWGTVGAGRGVAGMGVRKPPKFTPLKLKPEAITQSKDPQLIKRLKEVPQSLLKYATDEDKAWQLTNFGDMKQVTGKIAPVDTTKLYRPAVRLKDGTVLWHPKAGIHAEAISMQPKVAKTGKFDYETIAGSGAISPEGKYFESRLLGDVEPSMIEGVLPLKAKKPAEVIPLIPKPTQEFSAKFHKDIQNRAEQMRQKVHAYTEWKWDVGSKLKSKESGKIWNVKGKLWDSKKDRPLYILESGEESGVFDALQAYEGFISMTGPRTL